MIKIVIAAVIIIFIAVIAVLLLYNFGFIDFIHPLKKAQSKQIRVACVGDSITFGCTVRNWRKNNYPAVLGRLLGEGYCVNNFGYTNRTAIKSADYPYTNEKIYQQSLAFKPDIVMIMLGANDTKTHNWNKEKFIQDYSDIIDSYAKQAVDIQIYVLSPLPMFEINKKVMWNLRKEIASEEVLPCTKYIAEAKGVHYIDLYSSFENQKCLFSDGVHPNSKGSRLLAQKIAEVIKKQNK